MKKSIRIARITQIVGFVLAALGAIGFASLLGGDTSHSGVAVVQLFGGFLLIIGARLYEWLAKE